MSFTIHVNLSCEIGSKEEAGDALHLLGETLPGMFAVKSYSIWSPPGDTLVTVPKQDSLQGDDERQLSTQPLGS